MLQENIFHAERRYRKASSFAAGKCRTHDGDLMIDYSLALIFIYQPERSLGSLAGRCGGVQETSQDSGQVEATVEAALCLGQVALPYLRKLNA